MIMIIDLFENLLTLIDLLLGAHGQDFADLSHPPTFPLRCLWVEILLETLSSSEYFYTLFSFRSLTYTFLSLLCEAVLFYVFDGG